jgi:hypothetical protein
MLSENRSFKIDIPVDQALLPETRTPDSLIAEKHSNLSTPRVPKSPAELRKAEEQSVLLRAVHLEAVQARAARETQRAEEAKARRLREEANTRERLQSRFGEVAKRDAIKGEEKRQAAVEKALVRAHRAEEARRLREALAAARSDKLMSASERVAESARRAAGFVEATAAKNAHFVKRALAVVAAHKEQQREAAQAASAKLADRIAAATERRNDALELSLPHSAMCRVEMAKTELARLEADRQHKKAELLRSIAAAAQRRESSLESRVDKARADLSRVQAAHDTKIMMAMQAEAELAESRRAIFAKLNAADVRAKEERSRRAAQDRPRLGSRKSSRLIEPLAFELPARGEGARVTQLPAAVVERLQIKTRSSHIKPMTDLATRKSLSAHARTDFALKDLKAVSAAVARLRERGAALAAAVEKRARRGASLAQNQIRLRAYVARRMNSRVNTAAVKRATAAAEKRKALARRALREAAASGRRAQRLLAASAGTGEADRTSMFFARRDVAEASRVARAQSHVLRSLVVAMRGSEILMHKAARAHMSSLPYGTPAKLTQAGGVQTKQRPPTPPEACAKVSISVDTGSDCRSTVAVTALRSETSPPATEPQMQRRIPEQDTTRKTADVSAPDVSFLSDAELRAMHALAQVAVSDDSWQMLSDRQSASTASF